MWICLLKNYCSNVSNKKKIEFLNEIDVIMKAVICTKYGGAEVLHFKEVCKPVPKDNEVLIKTHATSVHIGDTRVRRADPFFVRLVFGLIKPKKETILGMEIAGVIESVGKEVKNFQVGDEVFALTGIGFGGYAEYKCLPEKVKVGKKEQIGLVSLKPKNLSFEEAAVVPAGCLTALKNLQKAGIQKDQKILINGASGSLGTYAVQLAKYFGAKVTGVCSTSNIQLVSSLGADNVIDYTKNDFTDSNESYDIVYDAVMKSKQSHCKKILKKNGVFLNNNGLSKINDSDLIFLKQLIEDKKLKPVIDRVYPLDDIVKAHRYVDTGHKKGNVAIMISNGDVNE
jgi:NADPH:quinone reductase-like Zn-dependent oxidoreductase